MVKAMWCGVATVLLMAGPAGADDGKLERLHDEIEGSDEPKDKRPKPSKCDYEVEVPPELFDYTGFWVGAFGILTNIPFEVPRILLHDDDYDFKNPVSVPYRYVEKSVDGSGDKPWALRAGLIGNYNFDDVGRLDLSLACTTASRFGVETIWTLLSEDCVDAPRDEAAMGQLDLLYRFAQGVGGELHVGIGCRVFGRDDDIDAGLNLVYSADVFPRPPWVLSTRLAGGTLGRAGLFDCRFSAGAMLKHLEIFAGYQLLLIGDEPLHGPLAGLRLWH